MIHRFALYWAPPPAAPLHRLGSQWLGRDAATDAALPQPLVSPLTVDRFTAITADPRGYGFHATLKPPMRLAEGRTPAEFHAAAANAAAAFKGFVAPALKVGRIGGFLALVPDGDMAPWRRLSDHLVESLDAFRAPMGEAEAAKRRGKGLTPSQEANLQRWGYPHLFGDWRFHMTLSASLTSPERERIEVAAMAHFAGIERRPVPVDDICVFEQAGPGAPFLITARYPLG